jgi:predicted DNA-binding antitoxin AbrB/MazE fold protein
MTKLIRAVYQNGVFRPLEKVDLPDPCEVEVEVHLKVVPATTPPMSEGLAKVYAILGERYDSGEHDVAARHNEHQP